jgi:hypothetical protein
MREILLAGIIDPLLPQPTEKRAQLHLVAGPSNAVRLSPPRADRLAARVIAATEKGQGFFLVP